MAWTNSIPFLARWKRRDRGRFERFNIVIAILLAGWVPSILMLVFSYTILTNTLESKILRDRQTFVHLIAHLIGDDLSRTGSVIEYYQTQPSVVKIFTDPNPAAAAQQWLNDVYYSQPRIDGMFIAAADGRLIASLPSLSLAESQDLSPSLWRDGAQATPGVYVSPVHPRLPDNRMATNIVGAVRAKDGSTLGYVAVQVLVERIGRRLLSIDFADQSICQVLDQQGTPLFERGFAPNTGTVAPPAESVSQAIHASKTGHLERNENLYSFTTIDATGWTTIVEQPKAAAYKPVQDLLDKIAIPALWLVVLTAVAAWLAGRFAQRQAQSAQRLEREVIFNEKILANMPSGIALIDPDSRHFLSANEAFGEMAKRFGQLAPAGDIETATYDEVKIAPAEAIEKVLTLGAPFQLVEEPFTDLSGMTHFVNVNLLRLQGAEQRTQGVLYLVEDKTRDVTLRQELIGANAAKDQFLALLSHELRNPLSPVIAMVEELEAHGPDTPEVRRALEVIRRNVELEARLIDDLLDVTRISKGKLQLSVETVNLHEILQRAYEISREEIIAKDLKIEFRFRAERSYVEGDPARLQQVFWNLLKNSVKFTPSKGRIVVETSNPSASTIELRITDTGIGIERDALDKIFSAFEQGQSSITRQFGGLGLGLAISKAMVTAHGGTIRAESHGKDRGSTFRVELATIETPATAAQEGPGKDTNKTSIADVSHRRLLVVDDHVDTCTGMKMMLERRGYRVTLAHTADEAVERTQHEEFDLVISDIGLPDRSGFELMQELRASKGLRGIALSGFGMDQDVNRAKNAGFSEHLTKPINFDRLEESIQNLLCEEPVSPA
ncbi:MAG: ATP-binding protein [Verrucomicrobiota bacterium]